MRKRFYIGIGIVAILATVITPAITQRLILLRDFHPSVLLAFRDTVGTVVSDSLTALSADGVTVLNDGTFKQKVFNNITLLKAASADSVGTRVFLKQISSGGVGGGLVVYCDSTDTETLLGSAVPNDVTIFSDPVADRVWVRETALQGIVYASDAGALGDGSTDDTNALQNSINAATRRWVLNRTFSYYKITDAIYLKSNVVYDFDQQPIRPTASAGTQDGYVTTEGDSNIVINNYWFDGTGFTSPVAGWANNALKIIRCSDIDINNPTILNAPRNAIIIGNTRSIKIKGGRIENCYAFAIGIESNPASPTNSVITTYPYPEDSTNYDIQVEGVSLKNVGNPAATSAGGAFYAADFRNMSITNCEIDSCAGRVITIKTQDYDSLAQIINFSNNRGNNIGETAVYLTNSDAFSNEISWVQDIRVNDNRFIGLHKGFLSSDTTTGAGGGITDLEVKDNYIRYKYPSVATTREGIEIEAKNSYIAGNYIEGFGKGLKVTAVAERATIIGNHFYRVNSSATSMAIECYADSAFVHNNTIDGAGVTDYAFYGAAGSGYAEVNHNIFRKMSGVVSSPISLASGIGNSRYNTHDSRFIIDTYDNLATGSAAATYIGDFTLDGTSPDTLTIPGVTVKDVVVITPRGTSARSIFPYVVAQADQVLIVYSGAAGNENYGYVVLSGK